MTNLLSVACDGYDYQLTAERAGRRDTLANQ